MKKIVILCNHFAPDNTIAAVRVTKIAKALKENGYQVTVIAEQKPDGIEDNILLRDADGIKVIRISNSVKMKRIETCYKKLMMPLKSKRFDNLDNRIRVNPKTRKKEFYTFQAAYPVIGSMDYLIEHMRQHDLYRMAKKYLQECLDADYAFTSYGDYFGLFAGKYLHKRNKRITWVFDIRDAICNYKFTPKYVRWIAKKHENYIWKEADIITAVSKGICNRVLAKYKEKVHCVTNGYDRTERQGIIANRRNKMSLAYTGSMYGGLQNLSAVFENVRILIDEKKIDIDHIEFLFAGKESAFEIFKSQAEKHHLDENCVYCGMVARRDALRIQMEADILLVSSFDYQAEIGGVITGKALEYMSANKPIIAVINGDVENSELAQIIRNARLGFAYEESQHERDHKALYHYLYQKYQEFKEKGELLHEPDETIVNEFDYQNICKKMIGIIEGDY